MGAAMKQRRTNRPDRLITPGATDVEIRCDHAVAPFDRLALDMERTWGIDRLPGLVSPATAEKFGRAMAHMNAMINEGKPVEVAAAAVNCMKGLAALDAEARSLGHSPACPLVWHYEHEGKRFGVVQDVADWPPVAAEFPGLTIYTMREVANALAAYNIQPLIGAVKQAFPGAEIKRREPTELEKQLEDEIPW